MMRQNIDENNFPMVLHGKVVHGKGLGRTVGMPTANVHVKGAKLPKAGVYATRIIVGGGSYGSVTNIGQRPSVDNEEDVTVECFILDFEKDIYGETVELELVKYLRPVQKFEGLKAVSEQVKKDIEQAKKCF